MARETSDFDSVGGIADVGVLDGRTGYFLHFAESNLELILAAGVRQMRQRCAVRIIGWIVQRVETQMHAVEDDVAVEFPGFGRYRLLAIDGRHDRIGHIRRRIAGRDIHVPGGSRRLRWGPVDGELERYRTGIVGDGKLGSVGDLRGVDDVSDRQRASHADVVNPHLIRRTRQHQPHAGVTVVGRIEIGVVAAEYRIVVPERIVIRPGQSRVGLLIPKPIIAAHLIGDSKERVVGRRPEFGTGGGELVKRIVRTCQHVSVAIDQFDDRVQVVAGPVDIDPNLGPGHSVKGVDVDVSGVVRADMAVDLEAESQVVVAGLFERGQGAKQLSLGWTGIYVLVRSKRGFPLIDRGQVAIVAQLVQQDASPGTG